MESVERYAVVSCHVERPLDDAVWARLERLLLRRPAGFAITALLRPPDRTRDENEQTWLERARRVAELTPLGHHTHWGGAEQARPVGATVAADVVRSEAEWLREHGIEPRFYCGGGWYLDEPVAETLASFGYVDCTATTFRQTYLADDAPRLQLAGPTRISLSSGASLLELPATHSLGMLGRDLIGLKGHVHVHFHDWELLDRRRAVALGAVLRALRLRRQPLSADQLARIAADAPERPFGTATIDS